MLTAESNPRPCHFRMVSWLSCLSGHYQFVSMCGSLCCRAPKMWGTPSLCSGLLFSVSHTSSVILFLLMASHPMMVTCNTDLQIPVFKYNLKSNGLQVLPHASFSSQDASSADGSLFTHLPSCTPKCYSPLSPYPPAASTPPMQSFITV